MVKDCKNFKKKNKKTPKKANRHRRKSTLSVELVARKITLKNDVGMVQERIPSLNVIGLKTHRTTARTPKHKHHNTTPHRLVPSPHQRRTIQKTNFATTPTQRSHISPTKCHNLSDLILQPKSSTNTNNN